MIKANYFGRVPYLIGLQIQECIFQRLHAAQQQAETSTDDHFLCLFEHDPPAYTVGIREQFYPAEEEERIRALGAEFHRVKRGGLITFHGPGQLVAYPIFNLRSLEPNGEKQRMGVRHFVSLVEEVLLQMLQKEFGLVGVGRTKDTGVWLDGERKIAAMGIQVRHGITSHGLALNCSTDLGWFGHIVPCGLVGKSVTSLSRELDRTVRVEETVAPLCEHFQRVFQLPVRLERNAKVEEYLAEGGERIGKTLK